MSKCRFLTFMSRMSLNYKFPAINVYHLIDFKNRFHVSVRLVGDRSQMTSKCGKDIKVTHEAIAKCVIDVLTTF